MKRVRKITAGEVFAAEDDSRLIQLLPSLKDDFDFIISGLEKLDRSGATESNDGLMIAEKFLEHMQEVISDISEKF